MRNRLARRELDQWAERFQFKEFWIGIHLKVASLVWIAGARENRNPLHEEMSFSKVCAPSGSIEDAPHLFPEAARRMRFLP